MSDQPDYPAPAPAPASPAPGEEQAAADVQADEQTVAAEAAGPTQEQLMEAWQAQQAAAAAEGHPAVAEQAGVAEDVQVTQPAPSASDTGMGLPDFMQPHAEEPAPALIHGTGNVSSVLPPGAAAAAGHLHAMLSHFDKLLHNGMAEVERFVPAEVLKAAEVEVAALLRTMV